MKYPTRAGYFVHKDLVRSLHECSVFAVGFWVFGWDDGGAGDFVVGFEIDVEWR
jgi:hypothetical protein